MLSKILKIPTKLQGRCSVADPDPWPPFFFPVVLYGTPNLQKLGFKGFCSHQLYEVSSIYFVPPALFLKCCWMCFIVVIVFFIRAKHDAVYSCLHKKLLMHLSMLILKKVIFLVCTVLKLCRSWSKTGLLSVKAASAVSRYEAILFTVVWRFRTFLALQLQRSVWWLKTLPGEPKRKEQKYWRRRVKERSHNFFL